MSESDIGNASGKRLPKTKFKLANLKIAERLTRVAALARPKVETAKILVVSPVGVCKCVTEGADWVVGKEAAAFSSYTDGPGVLLEDFKARVSEVNETKVVLGDDLGANDCGVSRNRTCQIHERLKGN
jgi:hypothetical protein